MLAVMNWAMKYKLHILLKIPKCKTTKIATFDDRGLGVGQHSQGKVKLAYTLPGDQGNYILIILIIQSEAWTSSLVSIIILNYGDYWFLTLLTLILNNNTIW
jgi:hypothetical protein